MPFQSRSEIALTSILIMYSSATLYITPFDNISHFALVHQYLHVMPLTYFILCNLMVEASLGKQPYKKFPGKHPIRALQCNPKWNFVKLWYFGINL